MSDLILDGFDHYGAGGAGIAAMLQGPWAETGGGGPAVPSWGTRTGEYALSSSSQNQRWRRVLPGAVSALLVGCGFSVPTLPTADFHNAVVGFLTGSNVLIAELFVTTTGALELRSAAGAVLASTAGPVVVAANWHYLEMKLDRAAGTFTLHIDDPDASAVPVIAAAGLALGATDISQIRVLNIPSAGADYVTSWMDDLVVRDTTGAVNNGFVGDVRIAALYPRADDVANANWTPRYRKEFGNGILDNRAASDTCVTAASSTSTDIGAADFTIEGFFRFFALPTGSNKAQILGKWDETNNRRSYQLYLGGPTLDSGKLCFRTSTDGQAGTVSQKILWPWAPDLNVWYHLAVVRTGGELLLFINGVQYGLPIADAQTYFAGTAPLALGAQCESVGTTVGNTAFTGFADEVRLTIGVGRYTVPFTPTAPFGRNVGADPNFASVALLCGFDSGINDESSYGRLLTARSGAVQNTPDDGAAFGAFSTIDQHAPRDDTFISAPLVAATSTLTLNAQPANNDTVRVGTKDGVAAATYRFRTVLAAAYDVLIDASLTLTMQNLFNAINAGAGSGVKYGAATLANFDVSATQLPSSQLLVTALTPGTAGNAIVTSVTLTNGGSWTGGTLSGGLNIPGPSDFYIDRPPPLTSIIRSVAIIFRGFKSDAGLCSIRSSLVGPLGGVDNGVAHSQTLSPSYYQDIYQRDPDTTNAITPSTLVGGRLRFTRTV